MKKLGEVRQVKPVALRWAVLESGTKVFYRDRTFTSILRRVPK